MRNLFVSMGADSGFVRTRAEVSDVCHYKSVLIDTMILHLIFNLFYSVIGWWHKSSGFYQPTSSRGIATHRTDCASDSDEERAKTGGWAHIQGRYHKRGGFVSPQCQQ